MKSILVVAVLLLFTCSLRAQSAKTVIYCTVDDGGRIYYGDLDKLLPDSLKTKILADPRKEFNLRQGDHVLLWMTMNGWKLVSVKSNVTGGGMITTNYIYILSREINLDTAARDLFMQNLLNSEKKSSKK